MEAEAPGSGLEDAEFAIGRQRRHGKIAAAGSVKGRAGVIARDTDFVFGFVIEGFEIVVGDWPIFKRTAGGRTVGGAHFEVLGHVAPSLRAVTECAAADAGCVVLVSAFTGKHGMSDAIFVDPYTWIALIFRAESIAKDGGALVAEVVFAAVGGGVPFATLKQNDAETGCGKFFGNDSTCCAGADDNRIDALHERPPWLRKSYWARPRMGGSARPSIRQLTASRFPP